MSSRYSCHILLRNLLYMKKHTGSANFKLFLKSVAFEILVLLQKPCVALNFVSTIETGLKR
jgi:hypothetical protein